MTTTHTPGPWKCSAFSAIDTVSADGQPIAEVVAIRAWGGQTQEALDTRHANAALIASAPELLDTLKMMKAAFRDNRPLTLAEFREVQSAIAKAEGRS